MRLAVLFFAVLPLVFATCRREPTKAADPLERITADSTFVVYGPSVHQAAAGAHALALQLEGKAGQASTSQLTQDIQTRLGFDPFTVEGLSGAGLDPNGGFAFSGEGDAGGIMVLPVKDAAKALETMARLAKQTEQADRVKQEGTITTYARPFGTREIPVMSAVVVDKFILVASGQGAVQKLQTAMTLKREQSMAAHPSLAAGAQRTAQTPIRFFSDVQKTGKLAAEAKLAEKTIVDVVGGIVMSATGVHVDLHALLREDRRSEIKNGLFPSGNLASALSIATADSVAIGQGQLALEVMKKVTHAVDPTGVERLKSKAAKLGFDVDEGLMQLTDGHYAGVLNLANADAFVAMLTGKTNFRRDLLSTAPFVAVMRPGPGKKPEDLITRVVETLKVKGLTIDKLENDPAVTTAKFPTGSDWKSYRFAVVGNDVLMGGGPPEGFMEALERLRKKGPPTVVLDEETAKAFARNDSDALLIRFEPGVRRMDEVMAKDLGTDADALTARTVVQKARGTIKRIQDLLIQLVPDGDGVRLQIRLRLLGAGA